MSFRSFIILFIIAYSHTCFSQEIKNIEFKQVDNEIEVYYQITGARYFEYFFVEIYVSSDGGETFYGPLKQVKGDIGVNVEGGKRKKIIWDVFKEKPDFSGEVVFDIHATVIEKEVKRTSFAGYKGSAYAPMGIMAGSHGKIGYYLSARINPNNFVQSNSNYIISDNNTIKNYDQSGYYLPNHNILEKQLSVTAGIILPFDWKWSIYAGTGITNYKYYWQIDHYDYEDIHLGESWVKHSNISFMNIEVEGGLMYLYNNFIFSWGISIPGMKFTDYTFSISYIF